MTPTETLLRWVRERESIRVRKERGDPFPWTDDAILRDWRFCNVRREDDRVTRWIRTNVREPFAGHPDLWLMLCLSRVVNWPPTLAELIGTSGWPAAESFSPRNLATILGQRAVRDEKVFTGAYTITAPPERDASKTEFVARSTVGKLWEDRDRLRGAFNARETSIASVHARLTQYPGWGPFMAYQAVVDMRFCPMFDFCDVASWSAAGPGTIRGLNRVAGRPIGARLDPIVSRREVLGLWRTIRAETDVDLDLSDVPNVLCEVDKYLRVASGEGTPRARYVEGRGW